MTDRLTPPLDETRDHILGPVDAPITLVEYGSYACTRCRAANEVTARLRDHFGEGMRYVFRHRPLPQSPGLLTLGYAIAVVVFIRFGERLLQRFGPRKPMVWGSLVVGASILLLMPTSARLETYRPLAVVAFTLFGIGLAFYATPSTDAALANLPDEQAGAGAGIYKMASSLGASFGVALSAAVFTALTADNAPVHWLAGVITFVGRQDNLAIREAPFVAFGFDLLLVAGAVVAILLTVPPGKPVE